MHYLSGPPVPASPGYHFLLAPRRLRVIVEQERPDVIEIGSPFTAPWLMRYATRGSSVKLVGFHHGDERKVWVEHGLGSAPRGVRNLADGILTRYFRAAYRAFDRTIATSRVAADGLTKLGISPVTIVPLGVDTELFDPSRSDPEWKAEVGASESQPVALYAGRLASEKNLDVVLEALSLLSRDHGLKVVMIGAGHMRERIERLSRERPGGLSVLPFEPDRERLARAYASADLFLAPCPYETFGLAALEAAASGTPVVGADAGGIGELLNGAGWGRMFSPSSPESLSRAVGEVLGAEATAFGAEARRAAEGYTWDRTFERLLEVYREVCSQG